MFGGVALNKYHLKMSLHKLFLYALDYLMLYLNYLSAYMSHQEVTIVQTYIISCDH